MLNIEIKELIIIIIKTNYYDYYYNTYYVAWMKADYGIELKFMLTKKLIGNCMRLRWENALYVRVIMEFMIVCIRSGKCIFFSLQSKLLCCVIDCYSGIIKTLILLFNHLITHSKNICTKLTFLIYKTLSLKHNTPYLLMKNWTVDKKITTLPILLPWSCLE